MYEVVIIGAGPSGMTAAVYSARNKLRTLLISNDIGGQTNWTNSIENYMGYQLIEGPELIRRFESQVKQFPVTFQIGTPVASISKARDGFEVYTDTGEKYEGKTLIVSSGKRSKPLNVPGEIHLRGRGVSYCATCDGPLFNKMNVAVVGGGNSALEAAYYLLRIAERVYLISSSPLTAHTVVTDKVLNSPNLIFLANHTVDSINGDELVSGISIRNMTTDESVVLSVQGVFVEVGLTPNSDIVKGIVELNQFDEIQVNCRCETSMPGIFAAGDVTNTPEKQIIIAAGDGAKAALQARRYLQNLTS
ncbi:MAG TPA: FAD-dependent oxidoreductase [Syntrophorhabdaceae bacterium]|nr:FAD-dependent oxidoreductase [Syntrophorhabdaceae bacterium]